MKKNGNLGEKERNVSQGHKTKLEMISLALLLLNSGLGPHGTAYSLTERRLERLCVMLTLS